MVFPYPVAPHMDFVGDLDDEDALFDRAREHALSMSSQEYWSRGAVLPPMAGGPIYVWHEEGFDAIRHSDLVRLILREDHLLMHGLGALLSADMVWRRRELAEAAFIM